jgi:hypothetical protein
LLLAPHSPPMQHQRAAPFGGGRHVAWHCALVAHATDPNEVQFSPVPTEASGAVQIPDMQT